MLVEKLESPVLSGVFDRLFTAESQEDAESGFDELKRLGEAYERKLAKAEADERKELGVTRTESATALAEAAEEWGMVMPEPKQAPE